MTTPNEPLVLRTDDGGVATLTLNRPQQFNALSMAMLEVLQSALDAVAADSSVRVVVIAANGKVMLIDRNSSNGTYVNDEKIDKRYLKDGDIIRIASTAEGRDAPRLQGLGRALAARISIGSAGVWWLGFSFITFAILRPRHAVRPLPPGQTYLTIGYKQLADLMQAPTLLVTALMLMPLVLPPAMIVLRAPLSLILLPIFGPIVVLAIFISRKARVLPEAMKYLTAYLLYNDGIQTVISISAIFAAQELKMPSTNLILVILLIQFVAFGGAYGFNWVAQRVGTRNAILLSLVIWSAVVIYAFAGMKDQSLVNINLGPISIATHAEAEFWILGVVIALILGGSQALSRSLFAQMIPKDQEAEFYSFYEISERGTSWLGTFIFGAVNQLFGSLRLGILSVIFFFVFGLVLLPLVNVPKAMEQGKQASKTAAAGAAD